MGKECLKTILKYWTWHVGGNLIYLAEKFPNVKFEGIDYDEKVVELACGNIPADLQNINRIIQGNWFDLDDR